MQQFSNILIIVFVLGLSACSLTPVYEKSRYNNGLNHILRAYEDTVSRAHADSNRSWQNGRLGNLTVNLEGGTNVGLCYHWQEIVYVGIQKSVKTTGWRAVGIAINEGNFLEHHAVLVYDPKQLKFSQIMDKRFGSKSYVLDPWKSGKPLVYTLDNWLTLAVSIENQPRLTKVERFRLTGHKP